MKTESKQHIDENIGHCQTFAKECPTDASNEAVKPSIDEIVHERLTKLNPTLSISYYPQPLQIKTAKGAIIYQENGQENLDCINNVSHIGHCHPKFVKRMAQQAAILQTNSRFLYDVLLEATNKLLKKFPPELCVVTFCNSGSEANDLAMQMADVHTNKSGVICLEGAYHGITRATMDISPYKWNEKYKPSPHVTISKSPCTYRGALAGHTNSKDYAKYIETIVKQDTGAFISELMQSCAGQVIPLKDFYKQIYTVLRAKGVVTIADEVQTGFGRIGSHFWAFEYYGVIPDIVTCGKAMGNGFPVAAVICRKEIAESFKNRDIEFFSTYGGNPMAMAATCTVLDVLEEEKLQQNALEVGNYLTRRIHELCQYPFVGDVRGVGLFQGIEIVKDRESKIHDGQRARKIILQARKNGVLVSRDGTEYNILKIKPPLVFSKQNVDRLIDTLEKVMQNMLNEEKLQRIPNGHLSIFSSKQKW